MENDKETEIENDNKKTRVCPHCKQEYKIKVGINNWKNLFRKPSLDDWITMFILIMLIIGSYAYTLETKQCKETLQNIDKVCMDYMNNLRLNVSATPELPEDNRIIKIYNNSNLGGENISNLDA